jgi:hypothetical protein
VTSSTEPAPSDQPAARPQVLYVMGAGRSGSTVFGVTLGNCEGVFYAGELDAWLGRSGVPQLEDPERLRFWSRVREGVPAAQELFGRECERTIDRSLSLLRVHRWPRRRRLRGPYRRVAESLYRSLARVGGTNAIVDTSHYPLRAHELQRIPGIELHILYLMRDPRSVATSFNNKDVAQYTKSTLATNVYLWLTTLLAIAVFLRQPRERRLFVRYEDFVADPQAVLADVLARVEGSAPPADLATLRTGMAFQGNRLLHTQTLALRRSGGRAPFAPLTHLLQLPFTALASRLRPRAGRGGTDRS